MVGRSASWMQRGGSRLEASPALRRGSSTVSDDEAANGSTHGGTITRSSSTKKARLFALPNAWGERSHTGHSRRQGVNSGTATQPVGIGKVEHNLGETVTSCAISEDSAFFAATSMNKRVVCYSSSDGTEVAGFTADAATTAVQCVGKGMHLTLVVGTFNGDLRFYSVHQARELVCTKFGAGGAVNCITVAGTIDGGNENSARVCCGGQSAAIIVYQLESTGPSRGTLPDGTQDPGIQLVELLRLKAMGPVLCISLSMNGMLLSAGGESKVVELWALKEPAPSHGGTIVITLVSANGLLVRAPSLAYHPDSGGLMHASSPHCLRACASTKATAPVSSTLNATNAPCSNLHAR